MRKYHIHLKASAFHQLIKKPLEDKNIFIALLPPTRAAEIVECMCKPSEICNFADDSTIYSCGKDLPKTKGDLICTMKNILKWFRLNS